MLLIGGGTVAASLQPRSFNPVADTVSVLAGLGATDRWVMTLVILAVGVCDIVTGVALRPAASAGRLTLIAGASAGMVVMAYPMPTLGPAGTPHAIWASLGLAGLMAWPALAWQPGPSAPWGLRRPVCLCAAGVMLVLLVWFVAEVMTGAGQAGLAERAVGAAQAVWPLAVVLSCRYWRGPAALARLGGTTPGMPATAALADETFGDTVTGPGPHTAAFTR